MNRWLPVLAAACVAGGVDVAVAQPAGRDRPRDNALKVGDPASDFKLRRLEPAPDKAVGEAKDNPVRLLHLTLVPRSSRSA